jgi:hypothetical protein
MLYKEESGNPVLGQVGSAPTCKHKEERIRPKSFRYAFLLQFGTLKSGGGLCL